uniref:Thymidine kinase n=1 Tax=Solanum tuberosum TaxID=4113 RepID=M1ABF9_SOLTU
MYISAPPISSVSVSLVFLKVKNALLLHSSHLAVNFVTVSASGIMSSTEPKLFLQPNKHQIPCKSTIIGLN